MRLRNLLMAALAVAAVLAAQQQPEFGGPVVSASERFKLYTGCAPVEVVAELEVRDAPRPVELTRKEVSGAARARLEAAGLLGTRAAHTLNLGVAVFGGEVTLWVRFLKPLHDPLTAQTRPAATWVRFTAGRHPVRPQTILSTLGHHIDTFINAYQRVNREDCGEGGF